ncbi:glycosyltransferase family 2 protein [Spirosoma rhododendri]|uniref:Glycosyltransferase family 2 protein n=1 Tax=Spirosoma rhododendri TaxID=2728024 RepID=A0A7L5DGH2_9BACT|nr:glycosyltransferase family 2 protein [Spirosoma rhododendri]QJD77015.1 glycosyltransferase family 2 protein [Spirosoma rhododendri]
MHLLTVPYWINAHLPLAERTSPAADSFVPLRAKLSRFLIDDPEVSIVIPAYNEEATILQTLSSMADQVTQYRTELIVVNNNSTDKTQWLLDQCGVRSVFVVEQGISYARQAGLDMARGQYVASADSDSLYPPGWVDSLIKPLSNHAVSCTYGAYSFIPSPGNSRFQLGLHELLAESFKRVKRRNREFVDVMGFNFAYRRADAQAIGGFRHDLDRKRTGRSEDGWMAYCLMERGSLQRVGSDQARVWTSDRRLMESGSLGKALIRRIRKEARRLHLYLGRGSVPAQAR